MSSNHDEASPPKVGWTPGGRPFVGESQPTMLGDFELRREIGRGGMGTVFEAWEKPLQRVVAVKVLNQHISASQTAVERFHREARAAAKLHHMHIIPIFAQGEDRGLYYYAMELIEGPSLHAIISDARDHNVSQITADGADETVLLDRSMAVVDGSTQSLQPESPGSSASSPPDSGVSLVELPEDFSSPEHFEVVARHMATIADALAYAHREGVVHRDIKPHNLILGKDGRMRISDFGLARVSEQPGVTMTGELIGSPLYMSPEQITMGPSKVDHRTDIYSLGATMYEWLTLTPPYPGETRERVISRILSSEPPPLRKYNTNIPTDLETICVKAVERDRYRRYQTADELRDDLQRFLQNRPIKAKRTGVPTRVGKFIARHQVGAMVTVAAVIALTLGSALYVANREAQSQAQAAAAAAEEAARAKENSENIIDMISRLVPPEIEATRRAVQAATPIVQDIIETGQRISTTSGQVQGGSGDIDVVGKPHGIARRAIVDLYNAFAPAYWASSPLYDECSDAVLGGISVGGADAGQARKIVNRCLMAQPDHFEARCLHAALCGQMHQYDTMADDARQLAKRRSHEPIGYLWLGLARLLLDDARESLDYLDHALELVDKRDPRAIWARILRGLALTLLDQPGDALLDLNEALALSPEQVTALLARACAFATMGDRASAVADLTGVIAKEPDNAGVLALRGEHNVQLGNYDAGIRDFDAAMKIMGQTPQLFAKFLAALMRGNPGPSNLGGTDESAKKATTDQSSSSHILDDYSHVAPRRATVAGGKRGATPPNVTFVGAQFGRR